MSINCIALGKRICFYRLKFNITQEKLAALTNCSREYIAYLESGTKTPSLPTLIDLANVLHRKVANMKFGEKVRDLRKKHSLTQDELAQCLGINKRTIIGWERDGRYPRSVEMLEKMADIFHVPLTYLQPDQSLFIERAAEAYGKKGKIEAQHLAFELTELFASGELTPQDMDGIMYEMHKAYFKYREQKREKERIMNL